MFQDLISTKQKCFYKFGVRSLFYVWKFIVNYEISERNFVRRSKHAQKQRCDAHEDFHEILRTKGETRPKTWRKIWMKMEFNWKLVLLRMVSMVPFLLWNLRWMTHRESEEKTSRYFPDSKNVPDYFVSLISCNINHFFAREPPEKQQNLEDFLHKNSELRLSF